MVPHNISCHTFRYIWFCNGKQPPDSILCHYAPPQPPGGDTVTERLVFKQSIGPVCHNQASTQDHSEHQPGPILYLITSSHTHTHRNRHTQSTYVFDYAGKHIHVKMYTWSRHKDHSIQILFSKQCQLIIMMAPLMTGFNSLNWLESVF